MWTIGPVPIDPADQWPLPFVSKIVSSFSKPSARVLLLPTGRHLAAVAADHTSEPDTGLREALDTTEALHRTAAVAQPSTDATAEADLLIAALTHDTDDRLAEQVTLAAARLLKVGGILAVLTHCDWTTGELLDPTGTVVTAAQNADLLYLQHIVAVHTPVHDGRFQPPEDTDDEVRARHRAEASGLPVPHRRIHSDVLVFAQPHEHATESRVLVGVAEAQR